MTVYATTSERRFLRDADHAVLGGVCAGIANYFGFNRCATRAIFIIALCVAFPFAAIAYFAIVLLIPAESDRYEYVVERKVLRRRKRKRMSRKERRRAAEEAEAEEQSRATEQVRERYRSLNERLAKIEKYVTSSRYDLDREFRNL
jgi:phage shock protein C